MLHADVVAADEHVIVLPLPDTFTALGKHGEVFVTDRGVNGGEDGLVPGPVLL